LLFNNNSSFGVKIVSDRKEQNDLFAEAKDIQSYYAEITKKFEAAKGGYRKNFNLLVDRMYVLGSSYKEKPNFGSYQKLLDDPFFDEDREKPKKNNVMKTVAIFGMKAKPTERQSALKIGAVLEYLHEQGVSATPGAVIARLKSGGGIDTLYRRHCTKKANEDNNADVDTLRDELDLLGGDEPARDEATDEPFDPRVVRI
jgi:hypothetical protein